MQQCEAKDVSQMFVSYTPHEPFYDFSVRSYAGHGAQNSLAISRSFSGNSDLAEEDVSEQQTTIMWDQSASKQEQYD